MNKYVPSWCSVYSPVLVITNLGLPLLTTYPTVSTQNYFEQSNIHCENVQALQ